MLISGLKGMAVGILLTLVLSLIFSIVALGFGDPRKVSDLLSYITLAMSALGVGITAVRSDSEHRLTSALLGGIMYVLLLFVISMFMSKEGAPSPMLRTVVWALYIGVCILGAWVSKGNRTRGRMPKNSPAALARRRLASKK